MRIAFCLIGIVGAVEGKHGTGRPIDYRIGHHFHDKHIFTPNIEKGNEVDVFIHSWSMDFKDKLIEIYNPKKYLIEPQIDFKQNNLRLNSIKSRWYSTKKSIELKSQYENENNFKYDFVIVSRFDCVFLIDLIFSNFDTNNFYASHRDDCSSTYCRCPIMMRFADEWFFSNSDDMNVFATLYDHWEEYGIKNPHSECVHHIYQVKLDKNLQHVFYQMKDHWPVRALFENCEYNSDEDLDINKLITLSSFPHDRFVQ